MARADGSVVIDTLMDTHGFNNGMADMRRGFGNISNSLKKLAGVMASVFAVKSLIKFGKEAIELGSDLTEVQNVVDVTFEELSDEVNDFAKNAIEQFGLSETAAKQYASTMGAMLKSMGFTKRAAADMGTAITGLAGDIASFYNLDAEEAFYKIRAGISGETEPLKQLGINLNVANLEQYAFTQGITKSYQAMTQQEQALLRYNYLLSVTTDAQGDFARTSDSWANQTRILSERFKALKATIGQGLINVFLPVIKVINTLLSRLATLANAFKAFTELITGNKASAGSGISDAYSAAADSAGDYADAMEDVAGATKAANKEAKKYLSGLDEIRTFEELDTSAGGTGGLGDGIAAAADVDFGNLAEGDTALDEMNGILAKIIEKLKELKSIFSQGFWDGLGDWEYRWDSIKDSIASIKASLVDIWNDPKVLMAADNWLKSIMYMFGSLVGSLASIGLTVATNLVGGIAKYLEQNKRRIKQYLISMFDIRGEINYLFAELFQSIAYVFEAFASESGQQLTANIIGIFSDAFMGITELASKLFRDIAKIIIKPFTDNKEAFRKALEGYLGVLSDVTSTIKKGIDNTFANLNNIYDARFKPFFDSVAQGLSDLATKFMSFWNGSVQPILNAWAERFDSLYNEHIQPMIDKFIALLGDCADALKAFWENVLKPLIDWLIDNILPTIVPIMDDLTKYFFEFLGIIADIVSGFIDIISGITEFLTGVFTGDWEKAWNGVVKIFSGIETQIKAIINAMLASIESMANGAINGVNAVIKAMNGLHFDIPDWVPSLGGKSFGFNIPEIKKISIPRLASGAVIPPNAPFAAILGDQKSGTNVEAPLATIEQAVKNAMAQSNQGFNGTIHLHVNLTGKQIYDEVIKQGKLQQLANGLNGFELA